MKKGHNLIPEFFHETAHSIEILCHWVLDMLSYAELNKKKRMKKLNSRVDDEEVPMALGTFLHITQKMKHLAHGVKKNHRRDCSPVKIDTHNHITGWVDLNIKYNAKKQLKAQFINNFRNIVL